MRRFDKKDNIRKANLLSEQRYLESKGLISEGKYFADILERGTKIKFNGRDAIVIAMESNPYQEISYTIKYVDNGEEDTIIGGDKRIELVNEGEFDDHVTSMRNSEMFPFQLQHSDPTIGKENQRINKMSKEQFKTKFEQLHTNETINTTDGTYSFDGIKFNSNYGTYDLIFYKPSDGVNLDKSLLFHYDPTTNYVMSKKDIKLLDDSENKVIKMLKYNK